MGRVNSRLIMNKFLLIVSFIAIALCNYYDDTWEISLYNVDTEEYEILSFDMSVGYATCDSTTVLIIIGELNSGRTEIILPINTVWNVRERDIIMKDSKVYHYNIIKKND